MNVVEDTIESMLIRLDELGALFTVIPNVHGFLYFLRTILYFVIIIISLLLLSIERRKYEKNIRSASSIESSDEIFDKGF